jgi:flagellar assembly factor FliW
MNAPIRISGTRFGDLEIPTDAVLDLPDGLIGVPGNRYGVITVDESPLRWLQSLDDAAFALPVCDPRHFLETVDIQIGADDQARIGAEAGTDVLVWTTVRVAPDGEWLTNLRAPIVVVDGRGWQVINQAADAPLRAPLSARATAA